MKAGMRRMALAAAGLLVCGVAHAQLLGGVGLPGLGLPAPAPPMAPAFPTTNLPTAQPPAVAVPAMGAPAASGKAQASARAAAAVATTAGLPPVDPGGAVATLELSARLKPQALGASRDALGVVSLKALDSQPAAGIVAAGGYRSQAQALLAQHPEAVEADAAGQPVVHGEILALDISAGALARARAAGFSVLSQERVPGLELAAARLGPPRGVSALQALRRLRALDPGGRYDLDHIYFESGASGAGSRINAPAAGGPNTGLRLGLIDGAAPTGVPALKAARLVQQAFAPGGLKSTAHAAAIASLLVGEADGFRGAAPGATLYVADVYGTTPAGGSALAVVRALGWLAQARVPVINISLVGPPNAVLAAGVAAMVARGHLLVAAVGNDGPAAAPLYPAAYPGVVAVTGVDASRRVLPEAGRGAYVAFAAPGADMLAAGLGEELSEVRGTSFAAPLVAGRLAAWLPAPDPARAAQAVDTLGRQAIDLGARGRDPVYGRGLVAFELAARPIRARYAAAPH